MMRPSVKWLPVMALLFVPPLLAQNNTDPPQIIDTTAIWFVDRDERPVFDPITGARLAVAFNPNVDVVTENDLILLQFEVFHEEIDEERQDNSNTPAMRGEVDLFIRRAALFFPLPGYPSPEPPPLLGARIEFTDEGFAIIDEGVDDRRLILLSFVIPIWAGDLNQARLRGFIDWDVRWAMDISVSLEEDPEAGDGGALAIDTLSTNLLAAKDTRFLGPNPPPFADAGRDRTVVAGSTIELDGGLTFDGTNVGFDPADPNVFAHDDLTFTWEWISGPVRVDPSYPDVTNRPQIAEVTLTQVGDYVFRLLVDDNINSDPSSDTVQIEVVSAMPSNRPPISSIQDLSAPVVVGGVIQLNGGGSNDPDGDVLSYRWVQTNEIGGAIDPAVFLDTFQPLSGLDDPVSTWQALKVGTYYFRLIVSDGIEQDSDTTVVQVVSTASGGVASPRTIVVPANLRDDASPSAPPPSPQASPTSPAPTAAPFTCGATPFGWIGLSLMGLAVVKRRQA